MKKQKNKAARKYYRQAKREIPLCFSSKKEYLSNLEDILEKAVLENPEISYPELTERLGTPKQQTEEYALLLSTEQLYKNIYTARRIHRVILVVAIILAILFGWLAKQIIFAFSNTRITVNRTISQESFINDSNYIDLESDE